MKMFIFYHNICYISIEFLKMTFIFKAHWLFNKQQGGKKCFVLVDHAGNNNLCLNTA